MMYRLCRVNMCFRIAQPFHSLKPTVYFASYVYTRVCVQCAWQQFRYQHSTHALCVQLFTYAWKTKYTLHITCFRHHPPCTLVVDDDLSRCMHVVGIWMLYLDSPKYFPSLQLDTEYRKKWDALVIKLEVVDRDVNTGTEVVHWATHFPVSYESSSLLCSVITRKHPFYFFNGQWVCLTWIKRSVI